MAANFWRTDHTPTPRNIPRPRTSNYPTLNYEFQAKIAPLMLLLLLIYPLMCQSICTFWRRTRFICRAYLWRWLTVRCYTICHTDTIDMLSTKVRLIFYRLFGPIGHPQRLRNCKVYTSRHWCSCSTCHFNVWPMGNFWLKTPLTPNDSKVRVPKKQLARITVIRYKAPVPRRKPPIRSMYPPRKLETSNLRRSRDFRRAHTFYRGTIANETTREEDLPSNFSTRMVPLFMIKPWNLFYQSWTWRSHLKLIQFFEERQTVRNTQTHHQPFYHTECSTWQYNVAPKFVPECHMT